MLLQLSLEILLSMSISILIAGIGYSLYAHVYFISNYTSHSIERFANLSEYYSGSLSNACGCQYG